MGDQTSSSCPPPLKAQVLVQCPRCSPPTLQRSAKMELQGREGTVGQHGRGGPTRGGPFSTQAPLPVLHGQWPLATGHSTPGPGSTAAGGPQPGQEGTAEASAATNQNSRPMNVFLPRTNQTSTSKTHHQHLSGNLGTSRLHQLSQLYAAGCWPVSQCSFHECIRDHERLRYG